MQSNIPLQATYRMFAQLALVLKNIEYFENDFHGKLKDLQTNFNKRTFHFIIALKEKMVNDGTWNPIVHELKKERIDDINELFDDLLQVKDIEALHNHIKDIIKQQSEPCS